MSVLVPSLHGRVLRAFALIVVLAVVLAVGVGYYVTERQMDGFVAQLIAVEADNVAYSLSRAYGNAGGWRSVEQVLADAGYRYADEGEEHEGRGEREEHGGVPQADDVEERHEDGHHGGHEQRCPPCVRHPQAPYPYVHDSPGLALPKVEGQLSAAEAHYGETDQQWEHPA